jgi:DNA-binding PadR family transcriptional regulator
VSDTRLKTTWYYILVSLAAGERHGLAIAREVLTLSDGRVRLWPATLYGALDDLNHRGLIELIEERRRPIDESERRRYYRITRGGRAVLTAETERLAGLVRVARSRVKPRAGESS